MNATLEQPHPIIPDTIPCSGSLVFKSGDWPDDEYRAKVASHILEHHRKDILWMEEDTCLKQIACLEMTKVDVNRMDRLVNTYGHELQ